MKTSDLTSSPTGPLILIVEDQPELVHTLEYNLHQKGFRTRAALTGQAALDALRQDPPPDLVLLDLMLPDMPGAQICRDLRNDEHTRNIPVIMLTARGEEIDRVIGFEVGADDYVVKPFSIRELILRIRVLLRRTLPEPAHETDQEVVFGRLRIKALASQVWVDQVELSLTALEFKLLMTLFERRGRTQSREVLLRDVWHITAEVTTRTVDTHIKRLREKLDPAGSYIETVRGLGYRFVPTPPVSNPTSSG